MNKVKTNIYIDGANLFYIQKSLGWFIDFMKFKQYIKTHFQIIEMKYYTGIQDTDLKMQSFITYLEDLEIHTVVKPLKKIRQGKGTIYKSNFDVEMTINMLQETQKYDVCILVSGDSDFHALVKNLQNQGKKVIVYSSRKMISWELKLSADQYVFLEDIKTVIERKKNPRL